MTTASPFRTELGETLKLALPLAAANVLQMAVYAIDVIFVARLGKASLPPHRWPSACSACWRGAFPA
jgi:MATE family multidrug resistance protein